MARVPDMSSRLRTCCARRPSSRIGRGGRPIAGFCGATPPARVQDGLAFIRTKRDPTPENIGAIRDALAAHCTRTGCVDVSRLVYAAHLGLVEEAYRTAETACLGPRGESDI